MSATAAYDIVKTRRIIGPVLVEGTLSAPDDIVTDNIFFVPDDTTSSRVSGFISRQVAVGTGVRSELVFSCVDTTTGEVEDRIVFSCPDPIDPLFPVIPTNPAICVPGFALQGPLSSGDVAGFVGYDATGCFRPTPITGFTEIICDELVADTECVEAIGAAILELAADGGPLEEQFCDVVDGCITDFFEAVTADPTGEEGTVFCPAVEACLAEEGVLPGLLECADLVLGDVQYEVLAQGPCPDTVGVLQVLPPSTDIPNTVWFSVYGDPITGTAPVTPVPFLDITTDIVAIPPASVVGVDVGFATGVTVPIYTFDPTDSHAYKVEIELVTKTSETASGLLTSLDGSITTPGPIVVSLTGTSVLIPTAGAASAGNYTFLLNDIAGVVSVIPMDETSASTITADFIGTTVTTALVPVLTTAGVLPADITIALGLVDADIVALGDDLLITSPEVEATVNPDGTVTFNLIGALPESTVSVKVNVTRSPLETPVTVSTLTVSTPPVAQLSVAPKQARVLPKLVGKK